jgi:hypothetical protein
MHTKPMAEYEGTFGPKKNAESSVASVRVLMSLKKHGTQVAAATPTGSTLAKIANTTGGLRVPMPDEPWERQPKNVYSAEAMQREMDERLGRRERLQLEAERAKRACEAMPAWKKKQYRIQRKYEVERLGMGAYPKKYEIEDLKDELAELDAQRAKVEARLKELEDG